MKDGIGAFRSVPVAGQGIDGEYCNMNAHEALNAAFRFFLDTFDYDLSLNYRGPFQDDITSKLVDITENTILESNGSSKVHRKVSFLMVECFQNIIKHADESLQSPDQSISPGMFAFRKKLHSYVINSINPVKPEDVKFLSKTVDLVNSMDRDTLKRMYKRQLQQSELDSKGGAGLGLIELARKSGQELQYQIEEREGQAPYFHQQVAFINDEDQNLDKNYVKSTREQFLTMEESSMLMQYKGDFSQRSIIPLLHIVENNLMGPENAAESRKIGHVLVEVLQNISKHGYQYHGKREGIFMLGKNNEGTFLVAGNMIKNERREKLQKHLRQIDGLSVDDLKQIHTERIKESIFSADKSNAGLGIIEIARACKGRVAYDFRPFDGDKSFFSLFACV
jgi:hypothetical protein